MATKRINYGTRPDGTPLPTQAEAVLEYLNNGGTLTQEEARAKWSVTRLPSIIHRLRNQLAREGNKKRIVTGRRKALNRFGAPCNFAEYHLEIVKDYGKR